jgi:S1-C subfamily serine protease
MAPRLLAPTVFAALALAACGGSHHPAHHAGGPKFASSGVALQTVFRDVVKEVSPSVVQVRTSEGLGSGHRVRPPARHRHQRPCRGQRERLQVTLASGRQVAADLVGERGDQPGQQRRRAGRPRGSRRGHTDARRDRPRAGRLGRARDRLRHPSDTVTSIAEQLMAHGRVTRSGRAALGIDAASVVGGGVAVVSVDAGGAAAKAGLRQGRSSSPWPAGRPPP